MERVGLILSVMMLYYIITYALLRARKVKIVKNGIISIRFLGQAQVVAILVMVILSSIYLSRFDGILGRYKGETISKQIWYLLFLFNLLVSYGCYYIKSVIYATSHKIVKEDGKYKIKMNVFDRKSEKDNSDIPNEYKQLTFNLQVVKYEPLIIGVIGYLLVYIFIDILT